MILCLSYSFENNLNQYVLLVQLMDSLGNFNHAVSVVWKCIFDSNYLNSLPSNIDSLNLICDCYDEEELSERFKKCIVQ